MKEYEVTHQRAQGNKIMNSNNKDEVVKMSSKKKYTTIIKFTIEAETQAEAITCRG